MPLTPGADPTAMMGAQAPMMGGDAPQGAGVMAAPQAGMPAVPPGSPDTTMMLGQMAAKLLQKQQGTQYATKLLGHIRTIMQKLQASSMFENPQAESDISQIIQKLAAAAEKLGKTGPSQSPELGNALAEMVGRAGGAGAASPGAGM